MQLACKGLETFPPQRKFNVSIDRKCYTNPLRIRCTFQNVNQALPETHSPSLSPAARKALPFTFKQQNNNQWSIINAEIILLCYPAECKATEVM